MSSPVVKICGVRTVHQARVAAEAGADMVGLVFAESRRRVTPAEAHEVTAAAYVRRPRFVGVFVNEDPDVIGHLAGELRLDLVQLSGDEAPEECARLQVPYLKVVHVRSGMAAQDVLRSAERYRDAVAIVLDSGDRRPAPCPRFEPAGLVWPQATRRPGTRGLRPRGGATGDRTDAPPSAYPPCGRGSSLAALARPGPAGRLPPTAYGGTGLAVDPAIAADVVRQFSGPVMLAGGLRPETVATVVRAVRPWGVDVSSGVETDGAKDEAKITAFVAAAKEAL
jgi:phosphoribosylanthranilate isomerase